MNNVNIRILKAVAACAASNEETRYYLKGVFVEMQPGVTRYTATDGRILAIHEAASETEISGSWIVPLETIRAIKLLSKDAGDAMLTANEDGSLKLSRHDGSAVVFRPVDGTFLDYKRVIPQSTDGFIAQFNGELLARIEKFSKDMGIGAPFIHHNGGGPAPVSFMESENSLVVVMPMRRQNPLSGDGYVMPQFLNPVLNPAIAA